MRRTLLAAILFALPATAHALDPATPLADYGLDSWSAPGALPDNSIQFAVQTSDGYLWIGTETSLLRYDGVRFVRHDRHTDPGFAPFTESGAIGPDGALLVGTSAGVFHLAAGRLARITDPIAAQALAIARDGSLWIAAPGTGVIHVSRGGVRRLTATDGLPSEQISSILADGRDVWVGTAKGVVRLRDDSLQVFSSSDGLASDDVRSLARAAGGGIWIGTAHGLTHFDGVRFQPSTEFQGGDASALFEDREGTLWIGSTDGVARLHAGRVEWLRIPGADVGFLYEDREGSLWIGSNGLGLHRLRDRRLGDLDPKLDVSALLETRDGRLWIASDAGITVHEGDATRTIGHADGITPPVRSLAEDPDGSVWAGTADGVCHLRGREPARCTKSGAEGSEPPLSLLVDHRGRLWVGGRAGLARSSDGTRFESDPAWRRLEGGGVNSIVESPDGTIWVSTITAGLFRIGADGVQAFERGATVPADNLAGLRRDRDGSTWLGTYSSGIVRVRDGHGSSVTTAEGLAEDVVANMLIDRRSDDMWVCGERTLSRIRRSELIDVMEHRALTVHPVVFGRGDGMEDACNAYGWPSAIESSDGRLLFSSERGVLVADPAKLSRADEVPLPAVEEAEVDGDRLDRAGDTLVVPPGARHLALHYTAPAFLAPERVRFRHRLVGWDAGWVEAGGERVAHYRDLPPGRYHFEVTAALGDSTWSDRIASEEIVIPPRAFSVRAWIAAAGAALAAFFAGVFVARRRRAQGPSS